MSQLVCARRAAACSLLALILMPVGANAQEQHPANPEQRSTYGPYSGKFLLGGRGLEKPLNKADTLLNADGPWTMSLWFHADRQAMTTLLAGLGDPAAEDSRYLGLVAGKPLLRLGVGNEVVGGKAVGDDTWHFVAATFDGVTAHLFLDGAEVGSGAPAMGPIGDAELLIGPDFVSNQEAKYRYDRPHLPPTVPARLSSWQHFGGEIADFWVAHTAASSAEVSRMAGDRPNFATTLYEDGSKAWLFQVREQVGNTSPQDPDTLPHSRAQFGKPVAKPLPPGGPTLEQTAPGEWTLARNWKLQAAPEVTLDAEQLSSAGADNSSWYAATVPGTVLTTLVDRGVYPDPDWVRRSCFRNKAPETLSARMPLREPQFRLPLYWRKIMRIGIDLGGTKIEALALSPAGEELARVRIATPPDYDATIAAVADLVDTLEARLGERATVGIGMPGSIVRSTGFVKNANSTWLNGRAFQKDISTTLHREVRCANDANCLAVSEATDGSAAGHAVVFAVIIGTGCGGGLAIQGRVHEGRNSVAGEWGHNSLPWPRAEEFPGFPCYCGKRGCLETWISGTALGNDYTRTTGIKRTALEVASAAEAGEIDALDALGRLEDRIARGLVSTIHVADPDVIVLGGGLSRLKRLYTNLPPLIKRYSFGGDVDTPILPALHGDSSGVRGAAWLWPAEDTSPRST